MTMQGLNDQNLEMDAAEYVGTLNIIGAGNVGKTLGYLFSQRGMLNINKVLNRSQASAEQAIKFMGRGCAVTAMSHLSVADITLIAVPDAVIENIADQLSHHPSLQAGQIVFHCCGALSSQVLQPLKDKGCHVASVHPMYSFANPSIAIAQQQTIYCAIEGDEEALVVLKRLISQINYIPFEINQSVKALYHAAGVFASNYVVTLSHYANECLSQAGVEPDIAHAVVIQLLESTLQNLKRLPAKEALTGPLQRGDLLTVAQHLAALSAEQKPVYAVLAKATLGLTEHDNGVKDRLRALIDDLSFPRE